MQELFEAIKTGSVTRRDVDLDLSAYDPSVDPTLGDMMPDYGQILTDEQIWDLVAYLKHEAIDTSQLYNLQLDDGTYPDRGRSFSNLGKDGNAFNGTHVYAHRCAECHGPHGTVILVDGEEYTVGGHTRAKPYEDQHKVKFGHLGSEMGAVMADTPLSDIQDLFKALADDDHFPAEPVNEGHGSGGPDGSPGLPSHPHAPDM
jgi:mono/diheme cytochrome c family protein